MKLTFKARLLSGGPKGGWTYFQLTEAQSAKLKSRGRVAVKGTANGFAFKNFMAPMGDGTHGMMFNKALQQGAGAKPGDTVAVVLELDLEPRAVKLPSELAAALAKKPGAKAFYDQLAYTHKKDFVTWLASAKRSATRAKRLSETVRLLAAGTKWKDR